MREIILFGGGGHCKSVIDVIETEGRYSIAGIIDVENNIGKEVSNYKIIASENDMAYLAKSYKYAFISLGQITSPKTRQDLFNVLKKNFFEIPKIISPNAYVSSSSKVGEGSIVMHGAILNASSRIGKNCIINSKALIEHDSIVEDNCHISTGAILNGNVVVRSGCFVGSSSVIPNNKMVDKNTFIKAGTLYK